MPRVGGLSARLARAYLRGMHSQTHSFRMRQRQFCFGAAFRGQPSSLHQPLEPALARDLVALWIRDRLRRDQSVRWHMIALHQDIELARGSYHRMSDDRLATWLLCQVRDARVMVFEVLPAMEPGQSHEDYARLIGAPVVPVVPEPALQSPSSGQPYHRCSVPFDNGSLPDRLAPECPHPAFRSESTASAQPGVMSWLRRHDRPHAWEDTLGAENGGGFLSSTTRVTEVEAGTILYRYYGGNAKPLGVWWFFHCYAGDPKQFAALPPGCTAGYLVKARVKKPLSALMGLGAPRCTNKPGGPVQCRVPYQPASGNPETLENDYLEIL
jgi:hypothetical protein